MHSVHAYHFLHLYHIQCVVYHDLLAFFMMSLSYCIIWNIHHGRVFYLVYHMGPNKGNFTSLCNQYYIVALQKPDKSLRIKETISKLHVHHVPEMFYIQVFNWYCTYFFCKKEFVHLLDTRHTCYAKSWHSLDERWVCFFTFFSKVSWFNHCQEIPYFLLIVFNL